MLSYEAKDLRTGKVLITMLVYEMVQAQFLVKYLQKIVKNRKKLLQN